MSLLALLKIPMKLSDKVIALKKCICNSIGHTVTEKPEYPAVFAPGNCRTGLEVIRRACVDNFPESVRRPSIYSALCMLHQTISTNGLVCRIHINGSFTTQKPEPDDVDVVCEFAFEDIKMVTDSQKHILDWVCEGQKVLNDLCHLFGFVTYPQDHIFHAHGDHLKNYWLNWFSHSRSGERKGLPFVESQLICHRILGRRRATMQWPKSRPFQRSHSSTWRFR